jgi:hypothetical protein
MYHGGSHPVGKVSTMQESKATGYLNDVPIISYDFQAPIREFGQISDKYRALKVLHLFLHDFGAQLARTSVTLPADNPPDPGDTGTLRYAVRDHNGSGFLFVNNHQRRLDMTEKSPCNIAIQSHDQSVEFPEFSLKNGRFAIFPYNLSLGNITLHCATAQPLCRISIEEDDYVVFFAYPDIAAHYIFEKPQIQSIQAQGAEIEEDVERFIVHVQQVSMESVITLQSKAGNTVHCVTLTREQAENAWKADVWGHERLLLSSADVTWTADEMNLCITDQETATFSMFPDIDDGLEVDGQPLTGTQDGIFMTYTLSVLRQEIPVSVKSLTDAEDGARQWEINVEMDAMPALNDIFLRIDFEGDIGQLFLGDELVADWFYDGRVWEIGLKRFADRLRAQPFCLHISPLLAEADIYLETTKPQYVHGRTCTLKSVKAIPQYQLTIQPRS